MEPTTVSYQFMALAFIAILNGIMVLTLGMTWVGSRKPYLAVACLAGLLEISRQIPNSLLAIYPDSLYLVTISVALQFIPSLVMFLAISRLSRLAPKARRWFAGIAALALLLCLISLLVNGEPESRLTWVIYYIPLTAITAALVFQAWVSQQTVSAGWVLLVVTGLGLLFLRVYVPFLEESLLFYLFYYIENLLFPLLLAALVVLELETTNHTVKQLLEQREQSSQDLQFIVDSSLDVILITDLVGLLKNWNRRAAGIFGYSDGQTIGKLHIDDLFVDNNWKQKILQGEEFQSKVEDIEGNLYDVGVRFAAVTRKDDEHMIFVIRQLTQESSSLVEA